MIELIDEFGAKIFMPINSIKYFKENIGGVSQSVHSKAVSIIENVYGDIFYLKSTCNEIIEKLFRKEEGDGSSV